MPLDSAVISVFEVRSPSFWSIGTCVCPPVWSALSCAPAGGWSPQRKVCYFKCHSVSCARAFPVCPLTCSLCLADQEASGIRYIWKSGLFNSTARNTQRKDFWQFFFQKQQTVWLYQSQPWEVDWMREERIFKEHDSKQDSSQAKPHLTRQGHVIICLCFRNLNTRIRTSRYKLKFLL